MNNNRNLISKPTAMQTYAVNFGNTRIRVTTIDNNPANVRYVNQDLSAFTPIDQLLPTIADNDYCNQPPIVPESYIVPSEYHLVAKDVLTVLGYGNPSQELYRIDHNPRITVPIIYCTVSEMPNPSRAVTVRVLPLSSVITLLNNIAARCSVERLTIVEDFKSKIARPLMARDANLWLASYLITPAVTKAATKAATAQARALAITEPLPAVPVLIG